MNVEIDSGDVIKLIEQFLSEQGLHRSLEVLEQESSVSLNAVDSLKSLCAHISHGRWDRVFEQIAKLRLTTGFLVELYEQIVLELAELGEMDTAREFLRNTKPMNSLRESESGVRRLHELERVLQQPFFSAREAYGPSSSKEQRRQHLCEAVRSEVCKVPASRLLSLLQQAMKWQAHQGLLTTANRARFDLFRGDGGEGKEQQKLLQEHLPKRNDRLVRFGSDSHAECLAFSGDGEFLVSGNAQGFVEVWDYTSGKLRRDLQYQADEHLMMHANAVLAVAFSLDSELIASACRDGCVKVWRVRTGACLKKLSSAHSAGVSCLAFSRDSSQLVTGSFDCTLRIHGLRSGRTLRELRGHTAFVNTVLYSTDCSRVYSGSSDGTVRVWDARTADCLLSWRPLPHAVNEIPVRRLLWLPGADERLVVISRSADVLLMTPAGKVTKKLRNSNSKVDLVDACTSSKGRYVFAAGSDSVLYCFDVTSGELVHAIKMHKGEVTAVAHHPHINVLASTSVDSTLKLWRP